MTMLWRLLFILIFSTSSVLNAFQYQLSAVLIFQNEACYLKEWIEYHKVVGVEHFWLYNNNSTDNYLEVLQPYIKSGLVELTEWPSIQEENDWDNYILKIQPAAYNDALKRSKNLTKWLAIIDADEYIVPMKDKTITRCLEKNYSRFAGLCINWQNYGTSNVESIPSNKLMIENLVMKADTLYAKNKYFKSIVRPQLVSHCDNPHYCVYQHGYFGVNARGEKINIDAKGIFVDRIRINHYWSRDRAHYYGVKAARYAKWGIPVEFLMQIENELNMVYDFSISKFVGAVRKAVFKKERS